jgi:predicted DNA-binding protein (MmcQ/YjbR family)
MDTRAARQYLLGKNEAVEDYPFRPDTAVYFIRRKMFATLGTLNGTGRMNLKCNPEEALALRDIFPAVIPGYHMNKKHWNTIILDGSIPRAEIERMIDNSYLLVIKGMSRKDRPVITGM